MSHRQAMIRTIYIYKVTVPILGSKKAYMFFTQMLSTVLQSVININIILHIYCTESGFGCLGVACWPLVPKFAGSNPAEAVGFLRAKKSSARLPSEGQ
jgi:hypothetical protein